MQNIMVWTFSGVCFLLSGSAVMLARSVDGNTRSASTREQMAEKRMLLPADVALRMLLPADVASRGCRFADVALRMSLAPRLSRSF